MSERDTISKMPRATTARGDFASGAAVWSCPGLATAVLAFLAPVELAWCVVSAGRRLLHDGCVQYLRILTSITVYRNS
jgi:hypothetical protein